MSSVRIDESAANPAAPRSNVSTRSKVIVLWAASVAVAAVAIFSLRAYGDSLATYVAFTSAPPDRKAAFLIERADRRFEQFRVKAAAAGKTGEGSMAGSAELKEVISLYGTAFDLLGFAPDKAFHDKLAMAYSFAGDSERMARAQAESFLFDRQFDAAVDALDGAESIEGRALRGQCLLAAGRLDEAAALAGALAEEAPGQGAVLQLEAALKNEEARAAAAAGNLERAAEAMRRSCELLETALKGDREELAIYQVLADEYTLLAEYTDDSAWLDKAAATLGRALEVAPLHAELHHRLGLILIRAGRAEAAAEAIEKAVDMRPNSASLHLDLRRAYLAAGMSEKAAAALRRALALDPRWVERKLERN